MEHLSEVGTLGTVAVQLGKMALAVGGVYIIIRALGAIVGRIQGVDR